MSLRDLRAHVHGCRFEVEPHDAYAFLPCFEVGVPEFAVQGGLQAVDDDDEGVIALIPVGILCEFFEEGPNEVGPVEVQACVSRVHAAVPAADVGVTEIDAEAQKALCGHRLLFFGVDVQHPVGAGLHGERVQERLAGEVGRCEAVEEGRAS